MSPILNPREKQITDLLLQGCEDTEIAKELNMSKWTIKAHFQRIYKRFEITSGCKRVKLASILYRRQLCETGQ